MLPEEVRFGKDLLLETVPATRHVTTGRAIRDTRCAIRAVGLSARPGFGSIAYPVSCIAHPASHIFPAPSPNAGRPLTADSASATIDSAEERQALLCNYLPPAGHAPRRAWTSPN